MEKGLVHVYTGNGKGKTTAAVGLGLRAYGQGLKVLLVQFLKSGSTGELISIAKLDDNFRYFRTKKIGGFFWNMNSEEKEQLKKSEQEALDYAVKSASSNKWDMIILDEVIGSIKNGLVGIKEVEKLIIDKPEKLEIVLTGRNVPEEIFKLADYVSEINSLKHPFEQGVPARQGIEF